MIKMSPTPLSGRNCIQMNINNILMYKGFHNKCFKQCTISYLSEKDKPGQLFSNYISMEEELEWIHNIKLDKEIFNTKRELKEKIISLIDNNIPVIIYADPIALPYNRNYKTRSVSHTIIITSYNQENNMFTIIDDSQNYTGIIEQEFVFEAATIVKQKYTIFYLAHSQIDETITKEKIIEVISKNTIALAGKYDKKHPESSLSTIEEKGIVSINKFIKDYSQYNLSLLTHQEKDKLYEKLYRGLYGISNQHNLYSEFLEENRFEVDTKPLTELLYTISQEWKIAAFMIFKGKFKDSDLYYKNMLEKVAETIEYEEQLIEKSIALLNSLNCRTI